METGLGELLGASYLACVHEDFCVIRNGRCGGGARGARPFGPVAIDTAGLDHSEEGLMDDGSNSGGQS